MKKLQNLGRSLSKIEQKKIVGGYGDPYCDAYCGDPTQSCGGNCPYCVDAGNASNPDKKGGSKICSSSND
jgi:hypothetical protein